MIVEVKPLIINAVDFTSYFIHTGYSVKYVKRLGRAGGMTQAGSMEEDLLDWKAVLTLPRYPLNETQISTLLSTLLQYQYPIVQYYDPLAADNRTSYFITGEPGQKYKGAGSDGLFYWTGTQIELTEK